MVIPGSVIALSLDCFTGCGSLELLELKPGVRKLLFGSSLEDLGPVTIVLLDGAVVFKSTRANALDTVRHQNLGAASPIGQQHIPGDFILRLCSGTAGHPAFFPELLPELPSLTPSQFKALASCLVRPGNGLGEISFHAQTPLAAVSQPALRGRVPMLGGFPEPVRRLRRIFSDTQTVFIGKAQIQLGVGMPPLRRAKVPPCRIDQ